MKWSLFSSFFLLVLPLCWCRMSSEQLLAEFMKDKAKYHIDPATTNIDPLPNGKINTFYYLYRADTSMGLQYFNIIIHANQELPEQRKASSDPSDFDNFLFPIYNYSSKDWSAHVAWYGGEGNKEDPISLWRTDVPEWDRGLCTESFQRVSDVLDKSKIFTIGHYMVINPYEVVDLRTVCEVRSQALDIKIVSYEYLTQKSKAMLEDCFRYKKLAWCVYDVDKNEIGHFKYPNPRYRRFGYTVFSRCYRSDSQRCLYFVINDSTGKEYYIPDSYKAATNYPGLINEISALIPLINKNDTLITG